jgi:hypothetical protein
MAERTKLYRGRRVAIVNPSVPCGGRKLGPVTDRAQRYRANSPACRPPGPKRCWLCGSTRNPTVHHLDGDETNTRPGNLGWACKSCNTALGIAFKKAGKGRPTRQYNPKRGKTPHGFTQYAWAVGMICRKRDRAAGLCSNSNDPLVLDAVKIIRETPAATRRAYAKQAASRRGSSRGFLDEVPF